MQLTTRFAILAGLATAPAYAAPALTTIASFTGTTGAAPGNSPQAALITDASGNLFGTTYIGGTSNLGTVFEIPKTGGTYGALSVLATFTGTANGANPLSGLTADAAGNLFGTTSAGGGSGFGTVFEIANTAGTYGALSVIATFTGTANGALPSGGLTADAAGNLFGTTANGGANGLGTVFEIAKTGTTYGTLTTLAYFDGTHGSHPSGALAVDAAGNLLGTTNSGGSSGLGTVFEVVKTGAAYAAPTTLATFTGSANGSGPQSGLTADAAGNLFGTTFAGGTVGLGTVFEIAKTGATYGTLTTLASFTGFNGATLGGQPRAGVIVDAAGSLFGTTFIGGNSNSGEVFEIPKTGGTYQPLVTVANISNNGQPIGGLAADASGNLFGTTHYSGTAGDGSVFEITGSGFQAAVSAPEPASILTFGAGTAALAAIRRRRRAPRRIDAPGRP
jgi:hypothetical protein